MITDVLTHSDVTIRLAAQLLTNNEIVAIPTETVYGLAANALSGAAVGKIFAAKGRPQDNPLISHINSLDMLKIVADNVPEDAYVLAKEFWPGPLTMILPRSRHIADEVCAGLDTAAVRMPNHRAALALIAECGFPLAAPSANLSGSPSPTTASDVFEDMNGRIPLIIDDGPCMVGVESTVISMVGVPTILRPGIITQEQLEKALYKKVLLSEAVLHELSGAERAPSPGMKYKHYAPKAKVILIKGEKQAYYKYVQEHIAKGAFRMCFLGEELLSEMPCVTYGHEDNAKEQARRIFTALRELDKSGAEIVYARCPEDTGEAMAVYNRMLRASAFNIVEV